MESARDFDFDFNISIFAKEGKYSTGRLEIPYLINCHTLHRGTFYRITDRAGDFDFKLNSWIVVKEGKYSAILGLLD